MFESWSSGCGNPCLSVFPSATLSAAYTSSLLALPLWPEVSGSGFEVAYGFLSFVCQCQIVFCDQFLGNTAKALSKYRLCSWFSFCRFVLLLFTSRISQSYRSVSLRHKRRQILQNDRSIVSLNYSRLSSYNSSLSSSILTKDPVEKVWSSPSTIWRSKVLSRSSLSSEGSSWSKHFNISLRHFRIWIHASFFSSAIYKFSFRFTRVQLHVRL